ncbi:MAG: NAD(P)H-hydrate epimerase, partial [Isosphaeraceae bacterium]
GTAAVNRSPADRSFREPERVDMNPFHALEPGPRGPFPLRPLRRDEVRAIDVDAAETRGVPTLLLMENAGRGAAAVLAARALDVSEPRPDATRPAGPPGRPRPPSVLVLCGPGNNGGDGGVLARHLDLWGFPVKVVWFAEPERLRGDAAGLWTILERSGFDQTAWPGEEAGPVERRLDALMAGADWVVDALFGTGLSRPVEDLPRRVIEAVNRAGKPVLALDLPSGLDADRGVPLGESVRALVTATFVAPKVGFQAPGAQEFTGEVVVVDIGAPRVLLEPFRAEAR